jgi:hypothetical protein
MSTAARRVRVRFLTTDEGGRFNAPLSGVRSQLKIGEGMTSCVLTRDDGEAVIPLGEDVEVIVALMFPEHFQDSFSALEDARFFEGSKLVAAGRFIDSGLPAE